MKSVLSIQDLSCVGRCSLTVALPVLSAMGHRCSVLPTAVLSTHTGFSNPKILPLTEHIPDFAAHWASQNVHFDAVTCGYLASSDQVSAVQDVLYSLREEGCKVIIDPAMGDHGRLYCGLDAAHPQAMVQLCAAGDILLPNVTEAALLTGLPYQPQGNDAYFSHLAQTLLQQFPVTAAVITGVSGQDGKIGFFGIHRETGIFSYQTPVVPRQFHGTGDLFAAAFTGAWLTGKTICASGVLAADFVRACVAHTPSATAFGVCFEEMLPLLWNSLKQQE